MGVAFKPRLRDTFGNKFRNGVKPAFCDFVDVERGKTIFSVFAGFVIGWCMSRYNKDIMFFYGKFFVLDTEKTFTAYDIMQNI